MPMNRIQFQPGLLLEAFLRDYGTEAQCEAGIGGAADDGAKFTAEEVYPTATTAVRRGFRALNVSTGKTSNHRYAVSAATAASAAAVGYAVEGVQFCVTLSRTSCRLRPARRQQRGSARGPPRRPSYRPALKSPENWKATSPPIAPRTRPVSSCTAVSYTHPTTVSLVHRPAYWLSITTATGHHITVLD